MERLNYDLLRKIGYSGYLLKDAPERVLQFGEGNFLRAFVDYFLDVMNEKGGFGGKAVLVQPIRRGMADVINAQEGLYTLLLRGRESGERVEKSRVISSVSRCVDPYRDFQAFLDCAKNPSLRFLVSNTTEAGIAYDPACVFSDAPPASFPGKLTRFLYERYSLGLAGFVILSCELIDRNGEKLRECVGQYIKQWNLGDDFAAWVARENVFCSTLVDRIVTGYPRGEAEGVWEKMGYRDDLLDAAEPFGLWVIEGPKRIGDELPFEKAGLPILVTDDHMPYKTRKVRILNGAHTSTVLMAYRMGKNIVRACMEDTNIRAFMNGALYEEIIPTLALPEAEKRAFAAAVAERFENPYIDHALLAISLNSVSKWRARVMPSLLQYVSVTGTLPRRLVFSLAALIDFYQAGREKTEGALMGRRGEEKYEIRDDARVLDFFYAHRDDSPEDMARAVIENSDMWGDELARVPGLTDAVAADIARIREAGMARAMEARL